MASLESHRTHRNGHARDMLRSRADDVISDFAELRRDVSRLADAATKAAKSEMHYAGSRMKEMRNTITERAKTGATYVSTQVRQHPGIAIGAAAGAGMVIGLLLMTSRKRH